MNKPIELLVVEDKEKHIKDARAFFDPIEQKGILHVTYAATLAEAEAALKGNVDLVITDVFFPTGYDDEQNTQVIQGLTEILGEHISDHYTLRNAAKPWQDGETEPPAGVYVVEKCKKQGVPVALNTDTYHHGKATEPICRYSRESNPRINMVDTGNESGSANKKDWRRAYIAAIQASFAKGEWIELDIQQIDRNGASLQEDLANPERSYYRTKEKVEEAIAYNAECRAKAVEACEQYGL